MTHLYVTDMAPNGTRSLIITDSDSQIIGCIDEAVFGGWLKHLDSLGGLVICLGDEVVYCNDGDEAEELCHENDILFSVDLDFVSTHLACSPVDPDGSRIIEALKAHGLDLTA